VACVQSIQIIVVLKRCDLLPQLQHPFLSECIHPSPRSDRLNSAFSYALAFTFAQRAFCAAVIFLRLAAEIVLLGLSDETLAFCFAQRAFCARLIFLRAAALILWLVPAVVPDLVWLDSVPRSYPPRVAALRSPVQLPPAFSLYPCVLLSSVWCHRIVHQGHFHNCFQTCERVCVCLGAPNALARRRTRQASLCRRGDLGSCSKVETRPLLHSQ
jgi:hypothetical protein